MAWPEPVGVVTWMGRDIWRPRFGAGEWGHCEGVALSRYDKVVYDWLDGILAS
jgi:hypothetical protein